jgi:hypothetical protein
MNIAPNKANQSDVFFVTRFVEGSPLLTDTFLNHKVGVIWQKYSVKNVS